ncbi:MAG: hypothetical protein FWD72_02050 [Eggerthellaceae bacterium]|nr:hypothetical protein [Eggerthellaceae bacterium]
MKNTPLIKIESLVLVAVLSVSACSCTSNPVQQGQGSVEVEAPDASNIELYQIGEQATTAGFAVIGNEGKEPVLVTLESCESAPSLPPGVSAEDVVYDEVFSKEFSLYTIDEQGALSSGWDFVTVQLKYTNPNDFAVRIDLGGMRFHTFDGVNLDNTTGTDAIWAKDRDILRKDYFTPVLEPGETATFTAGFALSDDVIDQGINVLVFDYDRIGLSTKNLKAFDLRGQIVR